MEAVSTENFKRFGRKEEIKKRLVGGVYRVGGVDSLVCFKIEEPLIVPMLTGRGQ